MVVRASESSSSLRLSSSSFLLFCWEKKVNLKWSVEWNGTDVTKKDCRLLKVLPSLLLWLMRVAISLVHILLLMLLHASVNSCATIVCFYFFFSFFWLVSSIVTFADFSFLSFLVFIANFSLCMSAIVASAHSVVFDTSERREGERKKRKMFRTDLQIVVLYDERNSFLFHFCAIFDEHERWATTIQDQRNSNIFVENPELSIVDSELVLLQI